MIDCNNNTILFNRTPDILIYKLNYQGLEITFSNLLELAKQQDEIYPARLAAMCLMKSRYPDAPVQFD